MERLCKGKKLLLPGVLAGVRDIWTGGTGGV